MIRIGLTGGIGSGKSTAAAAFGRLGASVIDSDRLAREVVEPGTSGLAAVIERFGAGMLSPDGTLDRTKLGQLVFADPAARAELNAIVHPLIARRAEELRATADEQAVLVHDVPLLAENGMAAGYDEVVVVEAPLAERLRRLAARGLDEAAARARIQAQASDEQRRAVATVLLDNSGSVAELERQVEAAWERILAGPVAAG